MGANSITDPNMPSPDGTRGYCPTNLDDYHEFMYGLKSFQQQYHYGEDIFAGTNRYPAVVMTAPANVDIDAEGDFAEMNFMLSAEAAVGDNNGLSFSHITGKGVKKSVLFKIRTIGYPGSHESPDDCLPLPGNLDLDDPVTRARLEMHLTCFWLGNEGEESPSLCVGDIVLIEYENAKTFDNPYAVKVLEKTTTPGAIAVVPGVGGSAGAIRVPPDTSYDMQGLFDDASARDIVSSGASGPKALEPPAENVAKAKVIADTMCKWTGPYALKDGSRKVISGLFVNGVIVKESVAPYVILLLAGLKDGGITTSGLFNSGFRAAFVDTVRGGATPLGVITVADQKTNVAGTTNPIGCRDWDGTIPSRTIKKQTSQQTLAWQNCNPTKGKRGLAGYKARNSKGDSGCTPGTSRPSKYSPHPTGIAIDMNTGSKAGTLASITPVYKWMMDNAWKYGYIRTVKSERWHWEYRPGTSMFAKVPMDHYTWNTYWTTAKKTPTTVPATSTVTTGEDAVTKHGDV